MHRLLERRFDRIVFMLSLSLMLSVGIVFGAFAEQRTNAIWNCELIVIGEFAGQDKSDSPHDLFRPLLILKGPQLAKAFPVNHEQRYGVFEPRSLWVLCIKHAFVRSGGFDLISALEGLRPYNREVVRSVLNDIDGQDLSLYGKGDLDKVLAIVASRDAELKKSH